MPRPRTTKGLAKRIELTYYQRLHPFRRWWRLLCLAVPAAGALWLLVMAVLGDQRIYTSGRVVTAHAMIDAACDRCHTEVPRPAPAPAATVGPPASAAAAKPVPVAQARGWFFRRVSDGACLGCHDGAVHHETQTFEATCVTCHVEHQGRTTLARITDRHCTLCHAELTTRSGAPQFERRVVSLATHPEFAVFRKAVKDQAAIKLSHETHLKADLPAGGGKRVTLGCGACHREDAAGKYMRPIVYETHCAQCHPLEVGPDLVVPHETPEIIRGFLLAKLTGRGGGAAAAPAAPAPPAGSDAPAEPEPSGRRRRSGAGARLEDLVIQLVQLRWWGGPAPREESRPPLQLAQRRRAGGSEAPAEPEAGGSPAGRPRGGSEAPAAPAARAPAAPAGGGLAAVAQAEKELFTGRQGCKYCHTLEEGEGLPKVVPTKIPDRWLPHSAFEHRAHRPLACVACHQGAPKSVETTDVLVPKVQVCRECHRDGGGARSECVECHLYHDRGKERPADGPLTVPEFVTGRPRAPSPAAKSP